MQSDLYRTLCDAAEPQAPEAAQLPEYINFWKGILGGQYFLTLFNPGGGADLPPSSLIKPLFQTAISRELSDFDT